MPFRPESYRLRVHARPSLRDTTARAYLYVMIYPVFMSLYSSTSCWVELSSSVALRTLANVLERSGTCYQLPCFDYGVLLWSRSCTRFVHSHVLSFKAVVHMDIYVRRKPLFGMSIFLCWEVLRDAVSGDVVGICRDLLDLVGAQAP